MMFDVVSSAAWIIFAPVSWCWPLLASAIESTSPRDLRPFKTTPGYFMVNREPILQSIHLISDSSCASPRLVTRLKTFGDQFCTVMYWSFARFSAMSSTTGPCKVGGFKFGGGHATQLLRTVPESQR